MRQRMKNSMKVAQPIRVGNRVSCIGNCGTLVLKGQGECRDCRRARVRAGKKRVAKMQRGDSLLAKAIRAWESAKDKFNRSKLIRWARPKQTVRGLHIPEPRRPFRF